MEETALKELDKEFKEEIRNMEQEETLKGMGRNRGTNLR